MPGNKGFTLVEVLVALTILAIGILGAVTILVSSLKMVQESQESTEAVIFVSSVAGILNSSDPDNLSAETFSHLTFHDKPVSITFNRLSPEQKLIRVNISLEMKSGQSRSYTLYIARK